MRDAPLRSRVVVRGQVELPCPRKRSGEDSFVYCARSSLTFCSNVSQSGSSTPCIANPLNIIPERGPFLSYRGWPALSLSQLRLPRPLRISEGGRRCSQPLE